MVSVAVDTLPAGRRCRLPHDLSVSTVGRWMGRARGNANIPHLSHLASVERTLTLDLAISPPIVRCYGGSVATITLRDLKGDSIEPNDYRTCHEIVYGSPLAIE